MIRMNSGPDSRPQRRHGVRWGIRSFTLVTLALVVGVVAAACGGGSSGGGGGPSATPATTQRVPSVRLAGSNIGVPQPFTASPSALGLELVSLLYDTLTWQNPQGQITPMLATSWEQNVGGDPTKIDFTLRSGVKWSDGQPFTAQDVVFTWQYSAPGHPGFNGTYGSMAFSQMGATNVVALSPTKVEFTTAAPDATFIFGAASRNFIIPQHVWQSVTNPATYTDPSAFVGTGPYTLSSYSPAQMSYQFLAKDSYMLGAPYVKEVDYVPAPDQLQALQNNLIDMADVGSSSYTSAQLAALDPNQFGKVETGGFMTYAIMWNLTQAPYNNVNFRQAIAWAIDRQDLANRLFPLGGSPTNLGMLEPNNNIWVPSDTLGTKMYAPVSTSKAGQLLDQAGLTIPAGQTMRYFNGQQFRPTIQIASTANDAFTIIHQELLAVGIDAQAQVMSSGQMNTNATNGSYSMILRSFGCSSDPADLATWLSSTVPMTWWHSYGWNNPQFESLFALERTQFNTSDRQQTSYQIERLVAQQLPQLFLAGGNRIAIYNKSVLTTWAFPSPKLPSGPAEIPLEYTKLQFVFANPSKSF